MRNCSRFLTLFWISLNCFFFFLLFWFTLWQSFFLIGHSKDVVENYTIWGRRFFGGTGLFWYLSIFNDISSAEDVGGCFGHSVLRERLPGTVVGVLGEGLRTVSVVVVSFLRLSFMVRFFYCGNRLILTVIIYWSMILCMRVCFCFIVFVCVCFCFFVVVKVVRFVSRGMVVCNRKKNELNSF